MPATRILFFIPGKDLILMRTGIVRRIDDLGRIVLPKELRRTLGISEGDPLEIGIEGRRIVLELSLIHI